MINTNIVYLDNSNNFVYSENSTTIKLQDMLQRLQTWKNEQSFNSNNGIDYLGVFNKRALLKPQLDDIISQYITYFQSITYDLTNVDQDSLTVNMNVMFLNGTVALLTFVV